MGQSNRCRGGTGFAPLAFASGCKRNIRDVKSRSETVRECTAMVAAGNVRSSECVDRESEREQKDKTLCERHGG